MSLVAAVAGSALAALFEVTLWPYVNVGGAHPHLVFVIAIVWATVGTLDGALAWGFAGGLILDVLAPRPLGTTALVLLVCVAAAAAIARAFAQVRSRLAAPVLATVPLSLLYSFGVALTVAAVDRTALATGFVTTLLPGAVFDGVLVVVIAPLILAIRARQEEPERVGW